MEKLKVFTYFLRDIKDVWEDYLDGYYEWKYTQSHAQERESSQRV